MLTAEFKVNGTLVGHFYFHRMTKLADTQRNKYDVIYYEIGNKNRFIDFELWHIPMDGFLKLVKLGIDAVESKEDEDND